MAIWTQNKQVCEDYQSEATSYAEAGDGYAEAGDHESACEAYDKSLELLELASEVNASDISAIKSWWEL